MKHIGIVDVTTIGATICANTIVSEAAKRDTSGEHPEFTMHSFSFKLYKDLIEKQDWNALANLIVESINKLEKCGANFIIIPSNTPHYGFARIQKKSPLPVLNIIEITADECVKQKANRVAVLGTKFTMKGGLYKDALERREIEAVVPNDDICERIHKLIMEVIIPSKPNPNLLEQVRKDIASLECDAAILGCTELPEVYNSKNLGKLAIDTTRLLAVAALEHESIKKVRD